MVVRHEMYHIKKYTWYVERKYDKYPSSADGDLGKHFDYCKSILNTIKSQLGNSYFAYEKRCICKLKEKLLGKKKGRLPEYKSISMDASKYTIP